MSVVRVRHENGVLKPVSPARLPLGEGEEIEIDLPTGAMTEPGKLTPEQEAEMLRQHREALREICGIVKDGPTDWSVRHDEILYGLVRQDEQGSR